MKTGKDLNIIPISPKNHYSTVKMDMLLKQINDEFYFFNFLPYNSKVVSYIKDRIKDIGSKINNVTISKANDGQIKRRNEILEALRGYYSTLKSYSPEPVDDEKVCKFLTAMFVKDKEKLTKDELYLKWIVKTKKFSQFYNANKTIESINEDCLKYFKITSELKLVVD